jgi:hypothetical protein
MNRAARIIRERFGASRRFYASAKKRDCPFFWEKPLVAASSCRVASRQ